LRVIDFVSISFAAAPLLLLGGLYVFIGKANKVPDDSTLMTILALLFLAILIGFVVSLFYNFVRLLLGGRLGLVGLLANGVSIVAWVLESVFVK